MEFLLEVLKRTETTDYKLKSEDLLILKQEILHKIPWQVCPMERSLLFRNDVILLTSFHFSPQTNSLAPFFVIIKHQQSFFLFSAARTSVLSHAVRQRVLDPGLKSHQYLYVCKYVDWNGFGAMLATKRSAGVTPEVNLRNPLHVGDEACKQVDRPWLWKTWQMLPEVQSRGISGATKRIEALQKI